MSLASSVDAEAVAGRILPPYVEIEYKTLDREKDRDKDTQIVLSFQVIYHANITQVSAKDFANYRMTPRELFKISPCLHRSRSMWK